MTDTPATAVDLDVLFIGGLHRSGTSLLHQLLRAHPEISGFTKTGVPMDEGQHLQTIYPPGRVLGGPGRFGFDPRSFMDETHPLATPANAAALLAEWGKHWDLSKRLMIEKSPPNLIRTRFLQALFPKARFVLIFRHPVVVAYATRKACNSPISVLIEHTLRCYERALVDLRALNSVHLMHYEELVSAPQSTVDRILHFANVGEFRFKAPVVPDLNQRYFESWISERAQIVEDAEAVEPGWLSRTEARCQFLGYALNDTEYQPASTITQIQPARIS